MILWVCPIGYPVREDSKEGESLLQLAQKNTTPPMAEPQYIRQCDLMKKYHIHWDTMVALKAAGLRPIKPTGMRKVLYDLQNFHEVMNSLSI